MVSVHRCQRPLTSRSSKARQQYRRLVQFSTSTDVPSKSRTTAGRSFSKVKPSPEGSIRTTATICAVRGLSECTKAGFKPCQFYPLSQKSPATIRYKVSRGSGRRRICFDLPPNHITELRFGNTLHTIIVYPGLFWRQCLAQSCCQRRRTSGCSNHYST